jgi:ankyrin repeat protein
MTIETFQVLYKLNPNLENSLNVLVFEAVRAGNRAIAYEMVKNLVKFPNWGFNQLHADVLAKKKDLADKIHRASVTKKANTNKNVTPLHFACINPDVSVLKTLLDANQEYEVVDDDMRRPIHYAAASEGPEPIKLLISLGATLNAVDN